MAINKPIKDYVTEMETSNLEYAENVHIDRMAKLGNKVDSRSYWYPWNHGPTTWDNLNTDKVLNEDSIDKNYPTGSLSSEYCETGNIEMGCKNTYIEIVNSPLLDVYYRNIADDRPYEAFTEYMPSTVNSLKRENDIYLDIENENRISFTKTYNIELILSRVKSKSRSENRKHDVEYNDLEYSQLVNNYISQSYGTEINCLRFKYLDIGDLDNPIYKISKNKDFYKGIFFRQCYFEKVNLNLYYPSLNNSYFKDCNLHFYYSKHLNDAKSYNGGNYDTFLYQCHLTNCNIYFHCIDKIWDLEEDENGSLPTIYDSQLQNCKIVADKEIPKVAFSKCGLVNPIIEIEKPKIAIDTTVNQKEIHPYYSLNAHQLNSVIESTKLTWNAY